MKPDSAEFVSNYPRGEYAGREVDLQAFKGLLGAYERCTQLTALMVICNLAWVALMFVWNGAFLPTVGGWLLVTILGLVTADTITGPVERSLQDTDEVAPRMRIGLALLAPFCLSLPLILIQRRRILREIQKYDRSLVGQLDSFRSTVLAMNLMPPAPVESTLEARS
ncbi:MAG TPA: hypothetical protein VK171_11565 [Fimbriimonas sp.]|nr:hypothetical protein [Fimbriimonas sp.]